jgi:DNA-binding transcriptional MerR regulator/methylmalonyl-CoA mutase cobalamin-binding subunit
MNQGSGVGSSDPEPEIGAGLSIRSVSEILGVPAPTIRSWERRYGIPSTPRSTGGHRRYKTSELTALRMMRDEIARGRRAADAAALVRLGASTTSPNQPLIADFLEAAYRLDPTSLRAVLDHAHDRLGLEEAVGGVLLPAMHQIGLWWQSGRCDVAHEHLATEAARAWLSKLQHLGPSPWHPETIILTCGPRDLHTLGLEAIGVLLADRGWECRLLGARTPPRALVSAVEGTMATAVVMVCHLAVGRRSAIQAMAGVQATRARIYYAGNAFLSARARQGVPGIYLGESVAAAAQMMSDDLLAHRPNRIKATGDGPLPPNDQRLR